MDVYQHKKINLMLQLFLEVMDFHVKILKYWIFKKSGDHLYARALPTLRQPSFVDQILTIYIEKCL